VGEVPASKAMMPVQLLFSRAVMQINKKGRPNSRPFAIAMF
jgi:hypothetical protein